MVFQGKETKQKSGYLVHNKAKQVDNNAKKNSQKVIQRNFTAYIKI